MEGLRRLQMPLAFALAIPISGRETPPAPESCSPAPRYSLIAQCPRGKSEAFEMTSKLSVRSSGPPTHQLRRLWRDRAGIGPAALVRSLLHLTRECLSNALGLAGAFSSSAGVGGPRQRNSPSLTAAK